MAPSMAININLQGRLPPVRTFYGVVTSIAAGIFINHLGRTPGSVAGVVGLARFVFA